MDENTDNKNNAMQRGASFLPSKADEKDDNAPCMTGFFINLYYTV